MVQWECSSSCFAPITALMAGISVRARSGISRPPGSLMYSASTSGHAASRRAAVHVVRVVVDGAERVHQRGDHEFAARLLDHRAQAICASTSFIGSARQKRRMPLRASVRKASAMNSGLARLPGDEAETGRHELQRRVGRGRAIRRMRSQGSSRL